jgi:hypothetical protein
MSDDSSALATAASPSPQTDADYDAIHAALMETARGRAFLAEYGRRNRRADVAALLAVSERIEAAMRDHRAAELAVPGPLNGDAPSDLIAQAGQPSEHGLDERVPAFSWLDMPTRQVTSQAGPAPAAQPRTETPSAGAESPNSTAADDFADLLFGPTDEPKPDAAWMAGLTETPPSAAKPANGSAAASNGSNLRHRARPEPRTSDPLAPLKAMSDEEKIALFS